MNGPVPPEAVARIGTDVDRLLRKLEDAARRVREAVDAEATHDVRVATRQLDALLDVWRDHLPDGRRRRARRALRGLRRALGPARERRVAIELLRNRLPSLAPGLQAGVGLLIERWERTLEALERDARSACRRRRVRRIRRRIERATTGVVGSPRAAGPLVRDGRTRVSTRERRAIERVKRALHSPADRVLHAARVAVKRWRYAIDRLLAADPQAPAGHRDTLVLLQRALGRVNDLAVLRDDVDPVRKRLEMLGIPHGAEAFGTLHAGLEAERRAAVEDFVRIVRASELADPRVLPLDPPRRSGGA